MSRLALVEQETFVRLCRSRDYLAVTLNRRVTLDEAAKHACLSPFHYHRMFVRAFGETPHDFLTRQRIDYAKRLLAREECPVTDVCLAVGYASLGSFCSMFRSAVGRSPSDYRQSLRRLFPKPDLAVHRFVPACFLLSFGSPPF